MRRSLRNLFALLAVVCVAGCVTGQPAGEVVRPSAESSPPPEAMDFAQRVLAQAIVYPGSRLSGTFLSDLLKQPFDTPAIGGLVDVYHLYTIDDLPNTVEGFLTTHLPAGASASGTGTSGSRDGHADGFTISMRTSGPNEYYAALVYEITAYGAKASELRVDAQVVWVANRPAEEITPAGGIAEVTGFAHISLINPSSGPVNVSLSRELTDPLRTVADSLPLAPPGACMEDALLYKIVFRPSAGAPPALELDGMECAQTVLVSKDGHALSPLNDSSCLLLRAVTGVLPAGDAQGTRSALGFCSA